MSNIKQGSALLSILIFTVIALTITSAAVSITIINTQGISTYANSQELKLSAESGIQEGVLRLLRDRSYTGSTLNLDEVTVTITVVNSGSYVITSTAQTNDLQYERIIQVTGQFTDGVFTLTNWDEI